MSITHYKCKHDSTRLVVVDYNGVKYCPKCRANTHQLQLTTMIALKIYNELEENSREIIGSLNAR